MTLPRNPDLEPFEPNTSLLPELEARIRTIFNFALDLALEKQKEEIIREGKK